MSYQYPNRSHLHSATSPSPLRQASTASSGSSAYSTASNPYAPSRSSTVSSNESNTPHYAAMRHKRGLSEATGLARNSTVRGLEPQDNNASATYKNIRQSLRPLSQAPAARPASPQEKPPTHHSRTQSLDRIHTPHAFDGSVSPTSPTSKTRPHSVLLARGDTIRAAKPHVRFAQELEKPDFQSMQKSSTGYLRTLSKLAAENGGNEEFSVSSPTEHVRGMSGRRKFQRSNLARNATSTGYGGRTWIDTQRQFLQAYEYLCHIGEAKEWIEELLKKPLPPIVELEEALRDGVTLAEIVQALHPDRPLRIFRHPKLQFRHSDNIALFFRLLAEVQLPDFFWFELVDLYEKKNIPKVIHCIHALSYVLHGLGWVQHKIENLVGQLEFEDHELEAKQKDLDKSGVAMPNFNGIGANFGAEPEPEPEPVETEEERIDCELAENEAAIADFQAQVRGALLRLRLGEMMQDLWDWEGFLVDMQSRVRGHFAREISQFRMDMRRFAIDLQSACRGFLARNSHKQKENHWRDREKDVLTLQSLIRARRARSEVQYLKSKMQRQENGIREFQAAIRGALARKQVGDQWEETREAEVAVQDLQAAIRGALARKRVDEQYANIASQENEVSFLQSAVRGMLQRQAYQTDLENLRQHEDTITTLQAAVRGLLARKQDGELRHQLVSKSVRWDKLQALLRGRASRLSHKKLLDALLAQSPSIALFQALARGRAFRRSHHKLIEALIAQSPSIVSLQALLRGRAFRHAHQKLLAALHAQSPSIVAFQAFLRAGTVRKEVEAIYQSLYENLEPILDFQSAARGCLFRRQYDSDLKALQANLPQIVDFQSDIRGYLHRQSTYDLLFELHKHEPIVIELQGLARGALLRNEVGVLVGQLEDEEEIVVELQALARGRLIRTRFEEKKRFYYENMEKVVKIQSFIRGRQQGEAYKSLTSGKNPPVGTIKNFVHLLNDSDFDFDEEIEIERLRKTVVQQVRQNETAEQYIDQLDIKIALLVKNKITLDEVVRHQKHYGGHVGALLTNKELASKDPFDLKALNKNSRKKLEHYQEMFFILQTQPQYLARLFRKLRQSATSEKESKRIEQLMMVLFGFAQKRREEYYLLKLLARSMKEEIDGCMHLQDYLRGNFFWSKILASYIRSPKDRKYLRDLLSPVIKENIIENEGLDLESDPLQIYRSIISNEELSTGQRSRRPPDVPREQAIKDIETRETFIRHLQDLRDICDQFFAALEDTLHRMPYGIRFVAQQMFEQLRTHFPHEDPQHLLQIVGHWVWKTYLQPSVLQPETWGVVDRGLSPLHKRNLGEVAKVIGQVAAGRLFGGENIYLQPLNSYVTEAIGRLGEIWSGLINVRDAEAHFDIDEFNDLYARTKPTLYIKLSDIFAIHHLILSDLPLLCPSQDDVLREVMRELGSAKNNETELIGVSSSEISLTLNPKFHDKEDPEAAIKARFMETKRCVLYIIRIQTGANLVDIMIKPITPEDEDKWAQLIRDELIAHNQPSSKKRSAYAQESTSLVDITSMSYAELKSICLENILELEKAGRISRHNQYQDLLNEIAIDIRTKHRRRMQRAKEIEGVRATLANLDEKARWLEEQLKSYNDYIEQAMVTLQNKKGKRRFLLPFTKQYNHERELQRSGRVPKFGSYKYSARTLADKGVLVSWAGTSEAKWDKLDITISSNQVGIFLIEGSSGSMMIPGASAEVPLDDLLQAQFDNHMFMNLFHTGSSHGSRASMDTRSMRAGSVSSGGAVGGEGALKLNVNLFLHLVFKKFYKDG